ncbi:hypothetical protein CASFOL_008960 [Castilleja foliolosa]|uniref:Replication factor A C-terminal domain-containing protein n=1 Tax=Castilleja foliolosa TaxID=1961234 RepID=A0ABD3E2I6_9LAMI
MALSSFDYEYFEIYEDVFCKGKRVLTIDELKEKKEDSKYWVEADIFRVDTKKEFWYLACQACSRKIEGNRRCSHCGVITDIDIYKYNVEVYVVDQCGNAKFSLWDEASRKLIGQSAEVVVALEDGVSFVQKQLHGKYGLFEVVTSENMEMDCFTVSRVTVDEEIMDIFKHKYKPHLCPTAKQYESFAAAQKTEQIPWNLDDKWLEDAKKWVQEEPKPDDKLMNEASKWFETGPDESLVDEKWVEEARKWLVVEAAASKPDDSKWPARKLLIQHEGKRKEPSDEVDPGEEKAVKRLKTEGSCEEAGKEGN